MTASYTCTSWCTDGDGHTDCVYREDQSCWGEEHVTVLGLEEYAPAIKPGDTSAPTDAPHVSVFAHRKWRAFPSVRLHLFRESGDNEHLSVDLDVHLTPDEAVQLAHHLLGVAALVESEARD